MTGVVAVLAAFVVLAIVLRLATAALILTGLEQDIARFQVRSAFFGVGFTTAESERVVNHPARRRVIGWMVISGAIGISGLVASSIVSLAREGDILMPLIALLGGIVVLWVLTSVRAVDRGLVRLASGLLKRTTSIEVYRYEALLRLSSEHAVALVTVREDGPLAGRPLSDLPPEAVVLGVQRHEGGYVDTPPGTLVLSPGDAVAVYGRDGLTARLDTWSQ